MCHTVHGQSGIRQIPCQQHGRIGRRIQFAVAGKIHELHMIHSGLHQDHGIPRPGACEVNADILQPNMTDLSRTVRKLLLLKERRTAVPRPVAVDGIPAEPAVQVFHGDISDGRCHRKHADQRMAILGKDILKINVFNIAALLADTLYPPHAIVGIEGNEIVIGLALGEGIDALHDTVPHMTAEMQAVLIRHPLSETNPISVNSKSDRRDRRML